MPKKCFFWEKKVLSKEWGGSSGSLTPRNVFFGLKKLNFRRKVIRSFPSVSSEKGGPLVWKNFLKNIFLLGCFPNFSLSTLFEEIKTISPQSLLDLECQNPELRGSSGSVEGGSLRLLMDFCIFSGWSFSLALIQYLVFLNCLDPI